MWDIIGDIHGEANALRKLLRKLNYVQTQEYCFKHPTRKVCFLGDYIDRGNAVVETLRIVKNMHEAGHAVALLGNHELNYLAYITKRAPLPPTSKNQRRTYHPVYVRRHNHRHRSEIEKTLTSFKKLRDNGKEFIDWFYTLPLYLETAHFRAVHAAWDTGAIANLATHPTIGRSIARKNKPPTCPSLDPPSPNAARKTASPTYQTLTLSKELLTHFHHTPQVEKGVNLLLKGITLNLPPPHTFKTSNGEIRNYVRIAWWRLHSPYSLAPVLGKLHKLFLLPAPLAKQVEKILVGTPPLTQHLRLPGYPQDSKPLFIGHYWLEQENIAAFTRQLHRKQKTPYLLKDNVCCLDFSAAHGGPLVAYRLPDKKNNTNTLDPRHFVWV